MNTFIGIDFGTLSCRVAYLKSETVQIVPNRFSNGRILPIFEYFRDGDTYTNHVKFSSIKQKIGFEETVLLEGKKVMVIDLASDIFSAVKEDAIKYITEDVYDAFITVPSCFPDKQRAAIRTAAEKAGFETIRLLDESMAAALASEIKEEGKTVLIYALGGGVFNASIFRIVNSMPKALWHEGDRKLGGNDFDSSIMSFIIDKVGLDPASLKSNITFIKKLKLLAEQVKIELSKKSSIEVDINIRDYFGKSTRDNLKFILTRSEFENMIYRFIENTISFTKKAIQESGLSNDDIDSVILIGGSSRIPLVERMVREEFGKEFIRASDELIVTGAAMYGSQVAKTATKENDQPETKVESLQPKVEIQKITKLSQTEDMNWLEEFSPYLIDSQLLWERGKQDKAITNLETLLQELPKFIANLHYNRGKSLLNTEKIDEAIISLEKGLAHERDNGKIQRAYHEALNLKGKILLKNNNLSEARAFIKKGLKYKPDCNGCLELLKQIEDAIRKQHLTGMKYFGGFKHKKKR